MQAKRPSISAFLFVAIASLASVAAFAGAPLKGIDVKLGKNPGGSPAASSARMPAGAGEDKIIFTSDGVHPVEIAASTIVKSKSNIANN